ncbi:MAG: serine/threonine-protein kinase [Polyangiaceae bacterium]
MERFLREARSAARLRTEHVARVIDVATLESGLPYIVLEYLEGADLDAWVRKNGPMPVERAVSLVLQACEAVAEAHALGIVHRDLKPHNLFLTTGVGGADLLKVLDFGVAKAAGFAGGVLTRSDSSVGSPLYMSPEQMRSSRDVDARTDIWSLGVTLYEIIAGRPPSTPSRSPSSCSRCRPERSCRSPTFGPTFRRRSRPPSARRSKAIATSAICTLERLRRRSRRSADTRGASLPRTRAVRWASRRALPRRGIERIRAALPVPPSTVPSGGDLRPAVSTGSQGGAWTESVATGRTSPKRAPFVVAGALALVAVGGFAAMRGRGETSVVPAASASAPPSVLSVPSSAGAPASAASVSIALVDAGPALVAPAASTKPVAGRPTKPAPTVSARPTTSASRPRAPDDIPSER